MRLAKLSPTRGFCAELSTALVILVASQYGAWSWQLREHCGVVGDCEMQQGCRLVQTLLLNLLLVPALPRPPLSGLPTSSSQVITGGIVGVGLCEVSVSHL